MEGSGRNTTSSCRANACMPVTVSGKPKPFIRRKNFQIVTADKSVAKITRSSLHTMSTGRTSNVLFSIRIVCPIHHRRKRKNISNALRRRADPNTSALETGRTVNKGPDPKVIKPRSAQTSSPIKHLGSMSVKPAAGQELTPQFEASTELFETGFAALQAKLLPAQTPQSTQKERRHRYCSDGKKPSRERQRHLRAPKLLAESLLLRRVFRTATQNQNFLRISARIPKLSSSSPSRI